MCFQIPDPTKVFHCGYYVLDALSRSPKRISINIGPILQRCDNFKKIGNVFEVKLIQNSEIRVFKFAIPQKISTVDIMSWIHTLGPSKGISSNKGPILQRCKNFEVLGNVFDMKLIQNSDIRVFKSGIHKSLPLWILCLGYTP